MVEDWVGTKKRVKILLFLHSCVLKCKRVPADIWHHLPPARIVVCAHLSPIISTAKKGHCSTIRWCQHQNNSFSHHIQPVGTWIMNETCKNSINISSSGTPRLTTSLRLPHVKMPQCSINHPYPSNNYWAEWRCLFPSAAGQKVFTASATHLKSKPEQLFWVHLSTQKTVFEDGGQALSEFLLNVNCLMNRNKLY